MKAEEIFEKHWTNATGKPLDDVTKHHMKYAIDAINEALGNENPIVIPSEFCACTKPNSLWNQIENGRACKSCGKQIKYIES